MSHIIGNEIHSDFARFLSVRDRQVGSFLELARHRVDAPESSLPIAVKDNISVQDFHLTCGSNMLKDTLSPYDATVVRRLREKGAAVVGKTNLDEFGMGSSCDTSALGRTSNPWDLSRVAGGSSGGSAAAVAAQLVPVALGSDTGGSVRQPAAFCGVYGLKPTYGTLSRWGLVAYASSLETIGILSRSVDLLERSFATACGSDERDHTSVDHPVYGAWSSAPSSPPRPKTIGVLSGDLALDPAVEQNYKQVQAALADLGYRTVPVQLHTLEYAVAAYYTIAAAEASANLSRYNGVRYGHAPIFAENPTELTRKARTEGFGEEVKLRIALGTYVLRSGFQEQYYTRAQKIRTLIRDELTSWFKEVDAILSPTFPVQAFEHGSAGMDAFQQKVADRFTVTANLAGLPALSVPSGIENDLPVGMQLLAPVFGEGTLFAVARDLERHFPITFPPHSIDYATWRAKNNSTSQNNSNNSAI